MSFKTNCTISSFKDVYYLVRVLETCTLNCINNKDIGGYKIVNDLKSDFKGFQSYVIISFP